MVALRTALVLVNALVFLAIGFTIMLRQKEARGSLRLAKVSVILAAFSTAGSFLTQAASALSYSAGPQNELLVKQLYILEDLFAMLVLAFLASFAVFATYVGPKRNLIALFFFIMALIPPIYLTFTYGLATISPGAEPEVFDFTAPPYTYVFYACLGIPLGLIPIGAFAKSYITARRSGNKVLSQRAGMMLSAIALNEATYLVYVFWSGIVELAALMVWIPVALFLLFAILKITSPVEPGA
nr:hypothetical protein [Candidatus Njordarchaeota archaeon]